VPDGLEPLQGELDDDTSWRGVQVSGDVAIHGAPDHVEIEESRCRQIRLTGCELSHLRATDVVFEDCELSGVVLSSATFLRVELSRCRLSGLVAPGLKAKDVRFVECKIDEANFRMSSWERCELTDCELPGADFYSAHLTRTRLLRCNLARVEVSKARLDGVALHGSAVDSIRGADALRGVVIGSDQVTALALPVFAALGIVVDDEYNQGVSQ